MKKKTTDNVFGRVITLLRPYIRLGKFPVQITKDVQLGLGKQPHELELSANDGLSYKIT